MMIIERVVTVEYLEPSMSRELLSKFPDKSSPFDFDYSQSGIWSPLIPRNQNTLIYPSSIEIRRKLTDGFEKKLYKDYSQSGIWSPLVPRVQNSLIHGSSIKVGRKLEDGFGKKPYQEKLKKVTMKIKKKISMPSSKKNKKVLDFSATPVKGSTPKKGWAKVLKATRKKFKKQKEEPFLHIKLADFLRNGEL